MIEYRVTRDEMDGGKSNYYGASFMVRAERQEVPVGDAGQDRITIRWRGMEAKTLTDAVVEGYDV